MCCVTWRRGACDSYVDQGSPHVLLTSTELHAVAVSAAWLTYHTALQPLTILQVSSITMYV